MPRSESRPRSRRVRRATDGRRGPARPKFGSKSAREKTSGETRGWRLSRPREIGRLGRRPPVLRKPSRAPALSQTGVLVSLSLSARAGTRERTSERERRVRGLSSAFCSGLKKAAKRRVSGLAHSSTSCCTHVCESTQTRGRRTVGRLVSRAPARALWDGHKRKGRGGVPVRRSSQSQGPRSIRRAGVRTAASTRTDHRAPRSLKNKKKKDNR